MILLIDNYDSFVHNLARYFQRLGQVTHVVRNDATTASEVRRLQPAAIVLSPGPCTPAEAGCSVEIVRELRGEVPIRLCDLLLICLSVRLLGILRQRRWRYERDHGNASE